MASSLDKDLKKVVQLEEATSGIARSVAPVGLAILFIAATSIFAFSISGSSPLAIYVIIACAIGGYMALNIGANDVANNMGPAVGGKALSMTAALVIAGLCEAAGAILAGGDVVETISRNIVTPPESMEVTSFVLLMMSALLAAALWVNVATILNAPVSTTHAVVGGVVGAALAAAGAQSVSWTVIGAIVASWVISPVMGGIIAAALLAFIKWKILFREDRVAAARRFVPFLIGVMTGIFAMYLAMKGLSRIWKPSAAVVLMLGCVFFVLGWIGSRPWVERKSVGLENRTKHIASLFTMPLIFAAALLSFAHGANDVANAVGPLAAIVAVAQAGATATGKVPLPLWVLVIGAAGITLGLALFGPRLIRTVGERITKMDTMRAYCVALSAATTVLIASALGLPVSSTHIAIGAIFGVGFLREFLTNKGVRERHVPGSARAPKPRSLNKTPEDAIRSLQKRERRKLVRRRHVVSIAAAWIITVPAAAVMAALLYLMMAFVTGA